MKGEYYLMYKENETSWLYTKKWVFAGNIIQGKKEKRKQNITILDDLKGEVLINEWKEVCKTKWNGGACPDRKLWISDKADKVNNNNFYGRLADIWNICCTHHQVFACNIALC